MSGGLDILSLTEGDITKMLSANTHLGAENTNFQMEQYIYKRRSDGEYFSLVKLIVVLNVSSIFDVFFS